MAPLFDNWFCRFLAFLPELPVRHVGTLLQQIKAVHVFLCGMFAAAITRGGLCHVSKDCISFSICCHRLVGGVTNLCTSRLTPTRKHVSFCLRTITDTNIYLATPASEAHQTSLRDSRRVLLRQLPVSPPLQKTCLKEISNPRPWPLPKFLPCQTHLRSHKPLAWMIQAARCLQVMISLPPTTCLGLFLCGLIPNTPNILSRVTS